MGWLYHRNYVGPDRRGGRFHIRFFERREAQAGAGTRASIADMVGNFVARGRKWVDTLGYFGPDRRTGAFSHFFLERRSFNAAGPTPTLRAALRQLRMRVLDAEASEGRFTLQERLLATALLADVHGRPSIGDLLIDIARRLEDADDESHLSAVLQAELLSAEAALDETASAERGV
jgi:hypothetical protein